MKHKNLSKSILGVVAIGMSLLTGCSFHPDFGVPSPLVSEGTVYFYTICHFNAVDVKTGEVKWKVETVKGKKVEFCQENE